MKKIYLIILSVVITAQGMNAQLTLLQSFHEPIAGSYQRQYYDSVGAVPNAAGTAMVWDFSNFVQKNNIDTETYLAASSVASASLFPGATLAEDNGNGLHSFYKSSTGPDKFEKLGEYVSNFKMAFTDPMTIHSWQMAYNSTYSDTYSGTISGGYASNVSGVVNVTVPGAGSIILPGGMMLSNVLQVKSASTLTSNVTSPTTTTVAYYYIVYDYYHTSQRYPLVTVSYSSIGNPTTAEILVNKSVAVGITDYNVDADFSIFPNPAKTNFNVNFKNVKQESCQLEISNISGQVVRTIELGNNSNILTEVDFTTLESGIYFVKTSLGSVQSTRKLIVE